MCVTSGVCCFSDEARKALSKELGAIRLRVSGRLGGRDCRVLSEEAVSLEDSLIAQEF